MARNRVLVVGSGGREHALAWRLARDPEPAEVCVAPGNDGIGRRFPLVAADETDAAGLISACRERRVDLVVVGPEAPLAAGVADALAAAGLPVFGPSRAAARLESSKAFAKRLMADAGVPTARAEVCDDPTAARAALARFGPPYVVKADGLASGKGVCVTRERETAEAFIADCLVSGRFGPAGGRIVVEEHLDGEEVSAMAICDGSGWTLLPAARDYKRARDGDAGPNTGGMGAFAPAPSFDRGLEEELGRRVVGPTLAAMAERGAPFRGALYCGLMRSGRDLRVVEFNCRFGDPEAQVVLPLLEGSLFELLASAARGALDPGGARRGAGATVSVALVDERYPEGPSGGGAIEGLEDLMNDPEILVFHAGSVFENGAWRVRMGRAVHVAARAASRDAARARVYGAVARLGGAGWRFRRDVAAGGGATAGLATPAARGA